MKDCYHSGCDVNNDNIVKINYDFLAKTTQVTKVKLSLSNIVV